MASVWRTSRRNLDYGGKTLVMAVLNATPDSFSDGGQFSNLDNALRRIEQIIEEGADLVDIGGESTRPNSEPVPIEIEIDRVVPLIEEIVRRFDVAVSIDTTKAEVAERAVEGGAEIINDISGLRFDERIAEVAARHHAGLILMHSRGKFETMHSPEVQTQNIFGEVSRGFRESLEKAQRFGVKPDSIALDIGFGFGKSPEQNFELIARLGEFDPEFSMYPMVVGTSRKSSIGKILGGVPPDQRLAGSLASVAIAVWNGARIVRAHDVKETVETVNIVEAIKTTASEKRS